MLGAFVAAVLIGAALLLGMRGTYRHFRSLDWERIHGEAPTFDRSAPMVLPGRPRPPKIHSLGQGGFMMLDIDQRIAGDLVPLTEPVSAKARKRKKRGIPPTAKRPKPRKSKKSRKKKRRPFRRPRMRMQFSDFDGGDRDRDARRREERPQGQQQPAGFSAPAFSGGSQAGPAFIPQPQQQSFPQQPDYDEAEYDDEEPEPEPARRMRAVGMTGGVAP